MKRKKIFEIYQDGDKFEIIEDTDNMPETSWYSSIVRCCLSILCKAEYLTPKEIDNMCCRLHEDHLEVLDVVVIEKIKEALALSNSVRKELYK